MEKSRRIKIQLFLLSLPLLVLASCDKSPDEFGQTGARKLEFSADVSAVTRSTIGWADFKCDFEPGDAIGIFAVPHGSQLAASGNYAQNVKLVRQSGGGWDYADSDQAIFFPAEGVTLDVFAYYPYMESPGAPSAISFDAGRDQRGGASRSELMRAAVSDVAESDNRISLRFEHLFAMIQLEVSPAADSGIDLAEVATMDVKLNALRSAVTFDLGAGTAVPAGDACRIDMECRADARIYRALVPVQPVTAGDILFSCTVEMKSGKRAQFNYEAAPNTLFESGVVRLYDVKLP